MTLMRNVGLLDAMFQSARLTVRVCLEHADQNSDTESEIRVSDATSRRTIDLDTDNRDQRKVYGTLRREQLPLMPRD